VSIIHSCILPENRKIPHIQPADNCKLTELMAYGFAINISNTAKDSAVGGSYSRSNNVPMIIKLCIRQARVIDGVNPAIAAKRNKTGRPIKALSHFFRPVIW
jgi:hypothetical protein